MLKFDTGRIKPIERENTSQRVLWQLVIMCSSLSFMLTVKLLLFVMPDLRRFLRRISDRIHVCPANIRVSDKSKKSVLPLHMVHGNSLIFSQEGFYKLRRLKFFRPYTGA